MSRSLFAAGVLALGLFCTPVSTEALTVSPLNDQIVSVSVSSQGETRDSALETAKREAVSATAGRVLLEDVLLRADGLLENYLNNYADSFVIGVEVLDDEFTGGYTILNSRVFVNYEALKKDLDEKRFLYKPSYKPQFTVFIEDRLDGRRVNAARQIMLSTMAPEGLKPYEGQIDSPPTSVDLRDDEFLLDQAVIACERRNIEIILTGTSNTTMRRQEKLYYDTFYFFDCEMEMSMIRTDTGEILKTSRATGSASEKTQSQSSSAAIQRASQKIAAEFYEEFEMFWPGVVQGKSSYSVLLTGTTEELTRIVSLHLESLPAGSEINLRKTFDSSAILTIETNAPREEVIEVLRGCAYPTLTVVGEPTSSKFEVQVSG